MSYPLTTYWLSEHIMLSDIHNTSIEDITNYLKDKHDTKLSSKVVSTIIMRLFPNVGKAHVKVGGKRSVSYRLQLAENESSTQLEFQDIEKLLPSDWFIVKKDNQMISCGHVFPAKCNGQNIMLNVTLSGDGNVHTSIADKSIELPEYGIPNQMSFTQTSVPALFRSFNVIRPCLGCSSEKYKKEMLSGNFHIFKETITKNDESTSVIRSKLCLRCVFLTSTSESCSKCLKCLVTLKRKFEGLNKENIHNCDNTLESNDEVREKLKSIAPNLTENQLLLIESQIKVSNLENRKGMRWDKEIISMSISMYNRNPGVYRDMVQNKWLQLPSESLISLYKNSVKQGPGIIPEMMSWMHKDAVRQKIPKEGFYGGLILDEMAIQEDLQIVNSKDGPTLYGLVDSGEDVKRMKMLTSGKMQESLANHVQQYVYNGLTGFRWPFANYPNRQADPSEIFLTTWKSIDALEDYGFIPVYCCMDGSSNNRAFLKMHFKGDPVASQMSAPYYRNPAKEIIFIMDPCHLLKKIRNSLLSSGFLETHQRLLSINGRVIIWKMWVDAYNWDRSNSFRVHHKLTDEHIFPNSAQKMRNKLAFDCLDDDMLNLMIQYTSTLTKSAQEEFGGMVELLKHTSFMVRFFRDPRPIIDKEDTRLVSFREVYGWFKAWKNDNSGDKDVHKRHKSLLTMETREDLDYLFHGFMSLVKFCVDKLKTDVVPSRINSDVIENVFCQERSLYHGPTTNPNYNEYRTGINSIILGQTTTSRKSNVGGKEPAKPFALASLRKKPLRN